MTLSNFSSGFDYGHRERISEKYTSSVLNKSKLKACLYLHILLWLFILLKNIESLLDYVDINFPPIVEIYANRIPNPQIWEYAFLLSIVPTIFALLSLSRNNKYLLWSFIIGQSALGLLPLLGTAILNIPSFKKYVYYRISPSFSLQIIVFSLYFSFKLLQFWKNNTNKKII
ncbi:unnamed protein product [Gordionus sp. m RMFG-2023]